MSFLLFYDGTLTTKNVDGSFFLCHLGLLCTLARCETVCASVVKGCHFSLFLHAVVFLHAKTRGVRTRFHGRSEHHSCQAVIVCPLITGGEDPIAWPTAMLRIL